MSDDYRKRAEAYMTRQGWTHVGAWWTRADLDGDLLFEDALAMQLRDDAAIIFDQLGV